jgi:OmpA-OmpF porin, OOP family
LQPPPGFRKTPAKETEPGERLMRLRAIAFALAAFAATGAGAWWIGDATAAYAERRLSGDLEAALAAAGHDWAEIRADGLRLTLSGEAPDETARFHAVEIARAAAGPARLEDEVAVARADPAAAPAFALELLRSDTDISLIGLVPADGARETIAAGLTAAGIGATVTDMLETADHPAPPGWDAALAYGLAILADLPRAKVAIAPATLAVTAVTEDETALAALTRRIETDAPEDVALALDLSAPRPVIAPYSLAFRLAPDGTATLVACSAETEEARDTILAAARAAGAPDDAECRLGLGAPSPDWAEAAASGIEAVASLGGGSFALTDMDALLVGPPGLDADALAAAGVRLDDDLPRIFTLATRGAVRIADEDGEPVAYAPEFRAVLEPGGAVSLSGPLADRSSQVAVLGFAEAIFGHERVTDTIVLDPQLPEGWPGRVLSGVEALALLKEGTLAITPETLTVSGRSLQEEAGREVEAFFAGRNAGPVTIDVAFDAEAAAAAAEPETPPEEACADAVKTILADEMILFETGSARIDSASAGVIDAIADALEPCPGARFEVAGHTDSSGRASYNQDLSERRAAAVVEALDGRAEARLTAVGYGPDRPIADNDTEEGRALNRRIEFALLRDEDEEEAAADADVDRAIAEGGGDEAGEDVSESRDEAADDDADADAASEDEADGQD